MARNLPCSVDAIAVARSVIASAGRPDVRKSYCWTKKQWVCFSKIAVFVPHILGCVFFVWIHILTHLCLLKFWQVRHCRCVAGNQQIHCGAGAK